MLDKIKGGLIGFAIGDAMGVATEFMTVEEIKREYGKVQKILGGGVFQFKCGETSDDTDMTIAVARGIISDSSAPIEGIGKEFLKWRATGPKDIGITISTTFRNYQGDWSIAAKATYDQLGQAAGNGTLMRCLPIAFAYSDLQKMEEVSILQSNLTHYEDAAAEACVLYNRIARRLLGGEELRHSILTEIKHTQYDMDYSREPNCPPSGYVVHTLKWVFYWLLNGKTFNEVVVGAVNMGHDSDTIAAIAGGLKGIEVGYTNLPYNHKRKLLQLKFLEELAEMIYEVRDMDTVSIKENSTGYLEELVEAVNHLNDTAKYEKKNKGTEKMDLLNHLIYLYRISFNEADADFTTKYDKWWNVRVRFRRVRRLLDLGAPNIIIEHELLWLKTEADHLHLLHRGIMPQYTEEQLKELEEAAEYEKSMEEENTRMEEEMMKRWEDEES